MLNLSYNLSVLVILAKAIFILDPIAFCAELSGIISDGTATTELEQSRSHTSNIEAERLAETEGLVN